MINMGRENNRGRDSNKRGGFGGRGRDSGSRDNNRFGGGNFGGGPRRDFDRGPREMHKAVCADCKAECEVPFKPSGEKPVYCKDCFAKHKPPRF